MRIVDKKEFEKLPIGTVFCLYEPDICDDIIMVKTGLEYGVMFLCPYWHRELSSEKKYLNEEYDSQVYDIDKTFDEFGDFQLFAIFNTDEIRRMINTLTYALVGCEGGFYE